MIIDDGVRNRGHRKSIFKESYQVTGTGYGPHRTYKHMACIDYANGFVESDGSTHAGSPGSGGKQRR